MLSVFGDIDHLFHPSIPGTTRAASDGILELTHAFTQVCDCRPRSPTTFGEHGQLEVQGSAMTQQPPARVHMRHGRSPRMQLESLSAHQCPTFRGIEWCTIFARTAARAEDQLARSSVQMEARCRDLHPAPARQLGHFGIAVRRLFFLAKLAKTARAP
eukprot:m.443307 g.443307  ORF g.443307 m.443307 type:complete len:158 (+) comp18952_c0_seq1:3114-3587(+)